MNRWVVLAMVVVTGFLLAACTTSPTRMKEAAYEGFLLDQACAQAGKGMDGSDVLARPADHSQHCLEACAASGYGVMVKEGSGYRYIPFDAAGSDLALRTVVKTTTRENDITVRVMGTLKEGVLVLSSIREVEAAM